MYAATPWLTERHGYDPTSVIYYCSDIDLPTNHSSIPPTNHTSIQIKKGHPNG
ncbi:hypothetical protein PTB13_13250 [Bacillus sp. MHSD17]|nr:hypothetical protein [Bacillus sp. MHSD17]